MNPSALSSSSAHGPQPHPRWSASAARTTVRFHVGEQAVHRLLCRASSYRVYLVPPCEGRNALPAVALEFHLVTWDKLRIACCLGARACRLDAGCVSLAVPARSGPGARLFEACAIDLLTSFLRLTGISLLFWVREPPQDKFPQTRAGHSPRTLSITSKAAEPTWSRCPQSISSSWKSCRPAKPRPLPCSPAAPPAH